MELCEASVPLEHAGRDTVMSCATVEQYETERQSSYQLVACAAGPSRHGSTRLNGMAV